MGKPGYHHGALRRALIDAATEVVQADGADAVKMRDIAKRAGVSVAAPYRHFADRDELMSAVAAVGHTRLRQTMAAAAAAEPSPLQQYRAHGVSVVTFAVANPHLFRVMNTVTWVAADASPEMAVVRQQIEDDTTALLANAQEAGELSAESPVAQRLAAEALVYGLARMFVDGQMASLGVADARAAELAQAVCDVMGMGLIPRD